MGYIVDHWVELAIAVALILAPTAALLMWLQISLLRRRRVLEERPETWPFWQMKPGIRYHVEIWPYQGRPIDFVDKFVRFDGFDAVFLTRTVRRKLADQVHVTPVRPSSNRDGLY